ncbi:interferon-inducible double-stranded RNA-dependent protein kinase activator A homolog isoform X5 [Helicoverpa armigera]|uniref:interferon-inducible double-stranded RNA-dependent protein kinase activator A homolog isoform X5 n=1 Tax=Helicoverpa armigera TaxID=29058 RepID=UPI0021127B81|nr:interferon-inducible double-stranded RNA-dependent protein kinase activator A homolog isoform X5 [Helicoverpa armigera]
MYVLRTQMDGNVVHPHPGVVPGGIPGVVHGMAVHGAGPDGEHAPHGPRRRYQNRPKPPNNLERLPLDEAAKREMESLPLKTPVSVLQELLARRGTVPKYELVQIEGMIHEPTFRYRVTVADLVAMGTGRSKKEAKHSAAKALLDKLTGAAPADQSTNGNVPETGTVVSSFEDKLMGNPVGWLQELCMSRFWPPPSYHAENDDNVNRRLPHERQFTIVCTLLKRREVGTGKSKKLAKRQAAYKMWQALQDNPPESFQPEEEVTPLNNKDFNFVQFLQEIASEQSFEVTYVDIEEKSMTGRCQCLVQLSTLPVAVCYGSGLTSKDAQSSAAQNALEYLKIMTKK